VFVEELVVLTNASPIPKLSSTQARATLTNVQGTTTWVTTGDLTCQSCEA
jgi:hypothetical protein